MRYGFHLPTRGPTATRGGILALAREGERLGLRWWRQCPQQIGKLGRGNGAAPRAPRRMRCRSRQRAVQGSGLSDGARLMADWRSAYHAVELGNGSGTLLLPPRRGDGASGGDGVPSFSIE